MRKRLLSIFTALSILISTAPVFASNSAETEEVNSQAVLNMDTPVSVLNTKLSKNNKALRADEQRIYTTVKKSGEIQLFSEPIDKSNELRTQNVVLDTAGQYLIKDVATTDNVITVTAAGVELILDNVSIDRSGLSVSMTGKTVPNLSPIKVATGASLTLKLQNTNTLKAAKYGAGIAVYAEDISNNYGTLIIENASNDAPGTLNVTGGSTHGPGIGTNKAGFNNDGSAANGKTGKIIINGGIINAVGGSTAAGIGGVYNSAGCSDIEISGGIITASGDGDTHTAPAIGGSWQKHNGNITINGGYIKAIGGSAEDIAQGFAAAGIGQGTDIGMEDVVPVKINGGSIDSSFNVPIKDGRGREVSLYTMSMPENSGLENKDVTVGSWSTRTDANGKLYVYLPSTSTSFALNYNNLVYFAVLESGTQEYVLELYDGDPCKCDLTNANISLSIDGKTEKSITVNKYVKQKTERLVTTFHPAEICTYPIHGTSVEYAITIDGVSDADVKSKYISESNGYITVKYAAIEDGINTIHVRATLENNGIEYTNTEDISIVGDDTLRVDLSGGSIAIDKNSEDNTKIDIKVDGVAVYQKIDPSMDICVWQSTAKTSNTITVGGGTSPIFILENLNVNNYSGAIIRLLETVTPTFKLRGNNTLTASGDAVVSGVSMSTMTIEDSGDGDGVLTATSANGAGLGKVKKLIINSGKVIAKGGNGGAGIGGSFDGAGIGAGTSDGGVFINGGMVIATGDGNGAGIGGGSTDNVGAAGRFVMTGGNVIAKSGNNGMGIGGGGKQSASDADMTIIDGGSVQANMVGCKNSEGSSLYLITLNMEEMTGEQDVKYYVGTNETVSESDKISSVATEDNDGNSTLYLYLPADREWIRVYKDDTTYYKYTKIEGNNKNAATAVRNPHSGITDITVAGQISKSFDSETKTFTITVPHNIKLDNVSPIVEYSGCELIPNSGTTQDFTAEPHSKQYQVLGDDMQSQTYTVQLNLVDNPNPDAPDTFDISYGDIIIEDNQVVYGGTIYNVNPNGYIITGNTSEHVLSIDGAEQVPPIIFKDLGIVSVNSTVQPVKIQSLYDVNVTVEGECSISSAITNALQFNPYGPSVLNISGDPEDKLTITGGAASAVNLPSGDATMKITGTTTVLDGMMNPALGGYGKLVTDSSTNIHITGSGASDVEMQNDAGNSLHQLTAKITADDTTASQCTYNGITYYLDNDKSFYLMVPDGDYEINVTYDGHEYTGSTTVNGADQTVNLVTINVTNVIYDSSTLNYNGGDIEFEVVGTLINGNVRIRLVPDLDGYPSPEELVEENNKVTINVPPNPDNTQRVIYTVYYIIEEREPVECSNKIAVDRNKGVCEIQKFSLDGQVRSRILEDRQVITVYMPYDVKLENGAFYATNELVCLGKITGEEGILTQGTATSYTLINDHLEDIYHVKSEDENKTKDYTIRIYNQPTPIVKTLSFKNNLTCDGGELVVTASGTALSSVQNAKTEKNREVYIYSDDGIDPVKAEYDTENDTYVAKLIIDPNESTDAAKDYALKVKIGDVEQTAVDSTLRVPRRSKNIAKLDNFTISGQVSRDMNDDIINVVMPYDADLKDLDTEISTAGNATYTPLGVRDFSSDVVFTVTAENEEDTKQYTVHVTKEATPVAESLEFTEPAFSSAGKIQVKLNGQNLENAAHAMTKTKDIVIGGELVSGASGLDVNITSDIAVKNIDGEYYATITVPANLSNEDREYELFVEIGGERQTLTGDITLKVPKKEANSKEITSFFITEGQSPLTISSNRIYLYVPYNTDLSAITPVISHTGVEYSPNTPQNFNNVVNYTIKAQDGSYNVYAVYVKRNDSAGVDSVKINKQPSIYNDTDNITVDINGRFIPSSPVNDTITISAVPRDGGSEVVGSVTFDNNVYGGHATATLDLLPNTDGKEKIYDLKITVNGIEQKLGLSGIITVPAFVSCSIKDFQVNGQVKKSDIDNANNKIVFTMPYNTDLTSIKPIVTINGDDYEPKTPQNFDKKSVKYTVSAAGYSPKTYTVTAERDGLPTIDSGSVKVTNQPSTFKGSKVNVEIEGTFFYEAKVKAVPSDGGTPIEVEMTMSEPHKASAVIDIDENLDEKDDKEYTLEFYLDGFESPIEYAPVSKITVPHRTTRAITYFVLENQTSVNITDTDIYVQVAYDSDIRSLALNNIRIDGDNVQADGKDIIVNGESYLPTEPIDYSKPVVYTVSSNDDNNRQYTVHVSRAGMPEISNLTYTVPTNFKGGNITVNVDGVFFTSAEISAIPSDGSAIVSGEIVSFEEGKTSATLKIPVNDNTEKERKYQLQFVLDGEVVSYTDGKAEFTVPRRTTRQITEFKLPEEVFKPGPVNETVIEGTDIYIDVPYTTDLSKVTPEAIVYDADSITPAVDAPQDFSNPEKPVQYTLTSSGDEPVTYTVHISRIGKDPYLEKMTVPDKQKEETVYDGDNITITLVANANLREVEPVLVYQGTDYSPRRAQDFSNSDKQPIVYTIVNEYGVEHKYNVTIQKKKSSGGGSSSTVKETATPTPAPTVSPEPTQTPVPTSKPPVKEKIKPYMSGYDEENEVLGITERLFKPNNTLTRAEAARILASLDGGYNEAESYASPFTDIGAGAWYDNYVGYAASKGYISGYDEGTYLPDRMITRAEFAVIIARFIGAEPIEEADKFSDLTSVEWSRGYVNVLADENIVSGYEDGTYRPSELVTRAEAAAIINRATGRKADTSIINAITCPYADVTESHWAYNDIILASCEI